MLVDGKWQSKWEPVQDKDAEGRFIRQQSAFTKRLYNVTDLQPSRLKLYVTYICPWATRTLIARSLLGLENIVDVSVLNPVLTDFGWEFGDFPGSTGIRGEKEGVKYIHQLYTHSQGDYTGRATVPVLWDNQEDRIINNESADILKIFNDDLRPIHQSELNIRPAGLAEEIDAFNDSIYNSLNNGVYRAGFATSQQAYEEAYEEIFATLDTLEQHFSVSRYAVGEQLTESDIRLFVTLIRFDVAYYSLFKTNHKPIADYSALSAYLERLLDFNAFAENTRIDHIKAGYYSIQALNPNGIVPKGPELKWFRYLREGV